MKKIYCIISILLLLPLIASAQEMSVKSFQLVETDLTANTPGTMVHDQNGNLCALIKLETSLDGFTFDVGSLGVREVKRVGGEIWVYVPFGIRKITISQQQLGVIRDYQIPCSIEKGRTYVMTLVAGAVRTIVEYAASKQFLYIELNPKDAILEINGKVKATDNGVYQELLPFGKYQYKAYSQNYHDLVGIVEVSNPDNTHALNLKLKPAFGHLSITTNNQPEIAGAAVYIDEKYIGEIPINNTQINSGTHRIRIIKELYDAYNEQFTITDEENKRISPYLNPDFAEVALTTSKGADIYINGERKGTQKWSGKLPCGSYIFETRQAGHIPYKNSYEISRSNHNQTIAIDGPTPIYGSLVISSTPSKGKISINGEYLGETPKYISKYVIGEYNVKVELDGYETQTKKINITEGNETSVSFSLAKKTVTKSSTVAANANKDSNARTITSKEATIKVGEKTFAKLSEGYVDSWDTQYAKEYIRANDDGSIVGLKEGKVGVWAYINGAPKIFTLTIVNNRQQTTSRPSSNTTYKKEFVVPQDARIIYSKEATIKIGEKVVAKLPEGYVDSWDTQYAKEYVRANSDGSITPIKKGKIGLWGYINGSPKIFTLNIVQ